MSAEGNRILFARFHEEVFNKRNVAALDDYFAADYIEHLPPFPGSPGGLEGLKQFVTILLTAFPDFRSTVEDTIIEDDRAVGRVTAGGTNTGPFLGIPPTGKKITWTEIHIARVANGKIVEHWASIDQLGMLQQLGIIPSQR